MKIEINKIKVTERIRKEVRNINELAENIRQHGLICPIAVMAAEDGYQLLAGLRRLRAVELNGETEIEANVIAADDAEAALKIEFSENEQREPFTYSEKMDYARLIEEIEAAKAKERMFAGKAIDNPVTQGTQGQRKSREAIGEKIGMSGTQYDRAKYIAKNAPPEIIEQLDNGERTIRGTYDEMRRMEKADVIVPPEVPMKESPPTETTSKSAAKPAPAQPPSKPPAAKKKPPTQEEYDALKAKKDELLSKFSEAKRREETLETLLHNTELQWKCEREGKNGQISELIAKNEALESELAAANARIKELEERYGTY